jgi:hypothetical protein
MSEKNTDLCLKGHHFGVIHNHYFGTRNEVVASIPKSTFIDELNSTTTQSQTNPQTL